MNKPVKIALIVFGFIVFGMIAIATTQVTDLKFQVGNCQLNTSGLYCTDGTSGSTEKPYQKAYDVVVCRADSGYDTSGCGQTIQASDTGTKIQSFLLAGNSYYFKRGIYPDFNITVSNITLFGDGYSSTIFRLGNGQNLDVVYAYNKTSILIEKIGIDGNKDQQTTAGHGINFVNITNSIIDVYVHDTYLDGVVLSGGQKNNIKLNAYNIGASNTLDGDGLTIRSDFNIAEAIIDNVEGDGILVKGSYNEIKGIINNAKFSGVALTTEGNYSVNNNILDVVVNHTTNGQGIILNYVTNTGSNTIQYNQVNGNVFYANGSGLYLGGTNVKHNMINLIAINNSQHGASLVDCTYNDIHIDGYKNALSGVSINSNSNYNTLTGNLRNNNQNGVIVQGDYNNIDISSFGNGAKGIFVQNGDGNVIKGIYLDHATEAGIDIYNSFNNSIIGAISHRNYYGIREREGSDKNNFVGLNLNGNTYGNIRNGTNSSFFSNIGLTFPQNLTMTSQDGTIYHCGVNNGGTFACS